VLDYHAFISVGAIGQRLLQIIFLRGHVCSRLRELIVVALGFFGGIGWAVLRRWDLATRRLNSSLRSHRTPRSCCRGVSSGLNKTLYASVGPNSRCRGHQETSPAWPGHAREEQQGLWGRMKPSRGHQSEGTIAETTATKIPPYVNDLNISPGLSGLFLFS
jgi:hypothetical protein